MSMQFPQNLALIAVAAFLFGWLLASISAKLSARRRAQERDPRDARIRDLAAELRVAQSEVERLQADAEDKEQSLADTTLNLEAQHSVISGQQAEIDRLAYELKGSVKKTRELRAELADRATQNIYAEAKIREVETELSVAQASADMLATGVFADGTGADSATEAEVTPPIGKAAG
jgi:chromosome segregation ATPase